MRPRSSRYSPRSLAAEDLEVLLVGRETLVRAIASGFEGSIEEGSARYELLVGPRGAGKSHLVGVIHHRLCANGALAECCCVVALDEEIHIASLLDLLARILGSLPRPDEGPDPRAQAESLRTVPGAEGERRAVTMIRGHLAGRSLLLITENLDRTLRALGRSGQERWRGILQTEGCWNILASTQTSSDDLRRSDRPFFHMFQERRIPSLDVVQCREVLRRLARHRGEQELVEALSSVQGLARVRTIHHMLGGNPRAMALIFPYLERASAYDLEQAFFNLADELTPYFQQQMSARSPAQQAILERLAEHWRPLSVSELAQATYSSSQSTSSQLRKLMLDGLVQRLSVGRESFYEIADPLLRIARSMKRADQAPTAFLRFLQLWHPWQERVWDLGLSRDEPSVVSRVQLRALFAFRAEADPFIQGCEAEIKKAFEAEHFDEALEIAETCYRKHPNSNSAIVLQRTLLRSKSWERLAEAAEEAYRHLGAEAALLAFWLYVRLPKHDLHGLRERVRGDLVEIGDGVPLRPLVDLALLWDGQANSELLDTVANRIARRTDHLARDTGLLARLREQGAASRVLTLEPAFAGTDTDRADRTAILWALVETGAKDEAMQRLDAWLLEMPPGRERALLAAAGSRLIGDLGRARNALQRAIRKWPEDMGLRALAVEVAADLNDVSWILALASWLVGTEIENIPVRIAAASIELLAGRYVDAADSVRTIPRPALLVGVDEWLVFARRSGSSGSLAGVHAAGLAIGLLAGGVAEVEFEQDELSVSSVEDGLRLMSLNLMAEKPVAWSVGSDAPKHVFTVFNAWCARLLMSPQDWALERFVALLASTTDSTAWLRIAAGLLWCACATVVHGYERRTLDRLIAALDDTTDGPSALGMIRAVVALPDDVRPYARLAAPERASIQQLFASMGDQGRAHIARLPDDHSGQPS
jgi:hypothetical protein